jgi:hypothetical protein
MEKPMREPLPPLQALRDEYAELRPGWRSALADAKTLPELIAVVHRPPLPPEGDAAEAAPAQGPLAALCFSGGGIRSATFNLGVLQGLARIGLLDRFDYLSSVSGGGYISSWLARWIWAEKGNKDVVRKLTRTPRDPERPEPEEITHLRQYSNYLTPRLGALSADTWTVVAIIVRNLILNWLVLLPILAGLLLIPLLAVGKLQRYCDPATLAAAALALELVAVFFMSLLRAAGKARRRPREPQTGASVADETEAVEAQAPPSPPWTRAFLLLGLLPLLAAIPLLLQAGFQVVSADPRFFSSLRTGFAYGAVWAIAVPLAALLASVLLQQPLLGRKVSSLGWDILALILSGAVEAFIFAGILAAWVPGLVACRYPLYAILGPGLVLGPSLLGRTLFIGFSSLAENWRSSGRGDADREWWSRWSAWELISGVVWIVASALVLFAPTLLASAWTKLAAWAGAGGLGTAAALIGKSASTPAKEDAQPQQQGLATKVFLPLAAPLFAVALVLLLAWGGQALLHLIETGTSAAPEGAGAPSSCAYVAPHAGGVGTVWLAIVGLVLLGFVMGWPVNVNRFSLQAFYRNRLVRAYLGASNRWRNPNLFTGFDPRDNVRLHELRANRPLPVFNLTLNLVSGENLAWQQRKAESFTATPLHCGAYSLGYRNSTEYGGPGGISLGTAVATSGAAASPNMGFYSSPVITFIMTLFNARLGIWLGNPGPPGGARTYRRSGPRCSARVILDEALGQTNACHPYVNLSDGGHFEDLGIYEMVRRRCHTIVVSDAGADPNYAFDDLGNAIRKIRIDLGIEIEFKDKVRIYPKATSSRPEEGAMARYCAVATIHYDRVDGKGAPDGTLVYVKPAICETPSPPPVDVGNYAVASSDFPQESTMNQWFSETQFESYRALGEAVIEAMTGGGGPVGSFDQFVVNVNHYLREKQETGGAAPA